MGGENTSNRSPAERRRRINKIKRFILRFLIAYFIITSASLVILHIRYFNLKTKINSIKNEKVVSDIGPGLIKTDDSNNLASASDTHKVYLTFEDGVSENTDDILNILAENNVKATFFVIGSEDENSKELYKRIVNEGHTIGMHSYSHKYSSIYSSKDSFIQDYKKISNLIYETTGQKPMYYRFPGGSNNKMGSKYMSSYIKYLNKENVDYVDWNIVGADSTSNAYSADELVENIASSVVKYKSSVVLLHDSNSCAVTVEALPKIIESLRGISAEILPIDNNTDLIQQVTIKK